MESEARQNPLSKVETIEQLRTTIDKLETIIEQLNSTSVVNLPSSSSVEALITTTEELENAISFAGTDEIAASSQKTVTSETQPIPTSEELAIEPEDTSITPQEQIAETPAPQPPIPEIAETVPPATPKTVTKPATKAQRKPRKPKQKKNWVTIAIIALIVAIIPIAWKYLSPEISQQLLSNNVENVEEVIENTVTKEPSLIATKPTENKLPKNIENSLLSEATEKSDDISPQEVTKKLIEDLAVSESPTQTVATKIETETEVNKIAEVANVPVITEGIAEPELENENIEPIVTSTTDLESPLTTKKEELEEAELIIASDILPSESVAQLETQATSESPLNIDEVNNRVTEKVTDQKLNTTIAAEPENIPEPEPKILVPENLVAEQTAEPLELKTVIHDIKLTPEQNLVATLRDQVVQLSENYQEDIVLSIEPNITNNILIVKITDDWYQLPATEQDDIVADMFTRSQKLEFRKLEIKDRNDNLVARSPVVGQNMIILRRNS